MEIYEGPRGDLAGAIATEAAGGGVLAVGCGGGGGGGGCMAAAKKKKKITCDRPEHRSAAFMLEPVSNLRRRKKGERKGRATEADRGREGVGETTKTEAVNN